MRACYVLVIQEQEARRAKLKNATGAAADDDTEECSEVDDGKRDDKEPQSKVARL
jgi:hypothetical protein